MQNVESEILRYVSPRVYNFIPRVHFYARSMAYKYGRKIEEEKCA